MSSQTPWWCRPRRCLVHPLTTLLLLGLIAASAWRLPEWTPAADSTAARVLMTVRGKARPTMHFRSDWIGVAEVDGQRQVIDMVDRGWSYSFPDVSDFTLFDCAHIHRCDGFWAMSREIRQLRLFTVQQRTLARGEIERDRSMVADYLLQRGEITAADAEQLRTGDVVHSRILWSGIVENSVVALAFLLAVLSIGWLSPAWWRQRRGVRRLRRHHCPDCNYSLKGLASSTCPECGRECELAAATSDTRVGSPNSTRC